jgi:hypothetical protein
MHWTTQALTVAALAVVLFIGADLAIRGERTVDHVGGVCSLVFAPLAAWLWSFRPFVELSERYLVVRNPLSSRLVPLANIKDAEPTSTGLALELLDGTVVVAWAVQTGMLGALLAPTPRGIAVRREILAAARTQRHAQMGHAEGM